MFFFSFLRGYLLDNFVNHNNIINYGKMNTTNVRKCYDLRKLLISLFMEKTDIVNFALPVIETSHEKNHRYQTKITFHFRPSKPIQDIFET